MNRVKSGGYTEAIEYIRACIPKRIDDHLETDWFCGTDPVFAGLHAYEDTTDGRSYRDTAHMLEPDHQLGPRARRLTTIVIPEKPHWYTVLHELGHVLHYRLGNQHVAQPTTDYARTNHHEAFAEAFGVWIVGPSRHPLCLYDRIDKPTLALFDGLWR